MVQALFVGAILAPAVVLVVMVLVAALGSAEEVAKPSSQRAVEQQVAVHQ